MREDLYFETVDKKTYTNESITSRYDELYNALNEFRDYDIKYPENQYNEVFNKIMNNIMDLKLYCRNYQDYNSQWDTIYNKGVINAIDLYDILTILALITFCQRCHHFADPNSYNELILQFTKSKMLPKLINRLLNIIELYNKESSNSGNDKYKSDTFNSNAIDDILEEIDTVIDKFDDDEKETTNENQEMNNKNELFNYLEKDDDGKVISKIKED